jgi:hypothetical protein
MKPSHVPRLRLLIMLLLTAAGLLFRAGPIKEFYPGEYFPEDRIYQNKPLHFLLRFEGNWEIITDPNEMGTETKKIARAFEKSGVDLLFIGATNEGFHVVRGQAVNLNEPAMDYATIIRNLNAKDVQNDKGLVEILFGRNAMVKWVYDKGASRIAEYFFSIGTYDMRIAFGTRIEFFEKFLPVYERIMGSLEVTGGL